MVIMANGHGLVAETTAGATHLTRERTARAQRTFEGGGLAALTDTVPFLPGDARGAFPLAAAIGILLIVACGAGSVNAFLMVARRD